MNFKGWTEREIMAFYHTGKVPATRAKAKKKSGRRPVRPPARKKVAAKPSPTKPAKKTRRTSGACKTGQKRKLESWTYPRCGYDKVKKKVSREAQREAWLSGWRPQLPPRPYNPSTTTKGKFPGPKGADPDLRDFDRIIVHLSGGKDSIAQLLYVIELCHACGLDYRQVVECWHQSVDGDPNPSRSKKHVFDWPVSEDYVVRVCNYLQVPLLFQWREEGILGGVGLKKGESPKTMHWEEPVGELVAKRSSTAMPRGYERWSAGGNEPREYNRLRWPATTGSLSSGRWCSSYVKIETSLAAYRNSPRFDGTRVLWVTGERREESKNRSNYVEREWESPHGTRRRGSSRELPARHIERWRPILDWCEIEVWAIIARHEINPHPAYMAGFGRLSCALCVFSSRSQLETIRSTTKAGKDLFDKFVRLEKSLKKKQGDTRGRGWKGDDYVKVTYSIKSRKSKGKNLPVALTEFVDQELRPSDQIEPEDAPPRRRDQERAEAGQAVAYSAAVEDPKWIQLCWQKKLPTSWSPKTAAWRSKSFMPAGAFGEDAGPS